MKLIDLHKEWMRTGILPRHNGLCYELIGTVYKSTLDLFEPSYKEHVEYDLDAYWGSEFRFPDHGHDRVYCLTRQTIVLFICAMHDEL